MMIYLLLITSLIASSHAHPLTLPDGLDLHPVLLFPGLAASQMEAKVDKKEVTHFFCRKHRDWFRIWLDPAYMMPGVIDCFFDNMKMVWNDKTGRTGNSPGVQTRVLDYGGTQEIEFLTNQYGLTRFKATVYFNSIVESLIGIGYERKKSIRGAPYDFRKAAYENEEYFDKTVRLIEQMYEENGNKSVILIGHSMGCMYSYYLLINQDQAWKDKYIKSWISIAAPFAGASDSLKALISGDNLKIPIYKPVQFRDMIQTFSSGPFLLPHEDQWANTPIVRIGKTPLYAKDYEKIFALTNNTISYQMWLKTKDSFKGFPFPNVTTHCLRGVKVPTPELMWFSNMNDFPVKPEIIYGAGDGTVNQVSADVCLAWESSGRLFHKEIENVKHTALLQDSTVVSYIVRQVMHANFAP